MPGLVACKGTMSPVHTDASQEGGVSSPFRELLMLLTDFDLVTSKLVGSTSDLPEEQHVPLHNCVSCIKAAQSEVLKAAKDLRTRRLTFESTLYEKNKVKICEELFAYLNACLMVA